MLGTLSLFIYLAEAIVILFLLRFLIDLSNNYSYHPITNSVRSFTNFVYNIPIINTIKIKSVNLAPILVSLIISVVFWVGFLLLAPIGMGNQIIFGILEGCLMTVKCFGYLLVTLMLIQALCSWLPSTREISYYTASLTQPIIGPVQKIIPPIGMIDISLMIVLLAIYALDSLFRNIFTLFWIII